MRIGGPFLRTLYKSETDMPWWVITYVCVLVSVSVAGCWDNYLSSMQWWKQAIGILSALFSVLFVFSYFSHSVLGLVGYMILPMLVVAIAWDMYELQYDLRSIREENAASGSAQQDMSYVVTVAVGMVVVPAYLAGFASAFRLIQPGL